MERVILCYAPHINLAYGFWDTLERLADDLIAVPNRGISHMAVGIPEQNVVVGADAPGVERQPISYDVRDFCADGSRILAYRFAVPLTPQQEMAGDEFLDSIMELPYDFLDLGRRAVLQIAEYLGVLIPQGAAIVTVLKLIAQVDISRVLGIRAYLCYRVVADWLKAMGFEGIDSASWGPAEVEQMVADRILCAGVDVQGLL